MKLKRMGREDLVISVCLNRMTFLRSVIGWTLASMLLAIWFYAAGHISWPLLVGKLATNGTIMTAAWYYTIEGEDDD